MKEVEFSCPYCAQPNLLVADPSGGSRQAFTIDCEVCCRPIRIFLSISDDGKDLDICAQAELME